MAETSVASNNKSVTFRGKVENETMMESKAQNAAMHAAAAGKSAIGIPKKVGEKFVTESHGQKVKKLPQHSDKSRGKKAIKRGAISSKAAAKHLKDY